MWVNKRAKQCTLLSAQHGEAKCIRLNYKELYLYTLLMLHMFPQCRFI